MNEHTPIRVLLVDDHPLVRDGISSRLQEEPHIEVVGQAGNGREAIARAHELCPDVVLMDITMPVMDGLEATRRFKAELPEVRVLILSMHDDQEYIVKLMHDGANGYVLKDVSSDELIKAIEAVHQGSTYLSAGASQSLFNNFHGRPGGHEPVLTRREETVLRLIAEGQCNKDIARSLNISVRTVETHRQNIKGKLDIHTAAGLARYAIEHKLVSLG
ncbi:response regulator [Sedimenticola hydrogenitrophicus]|uniref:response regulator n=1 Tax=Sedimenticola hydrogenitrophicus TaxID=2967975 RepID=UPI0023B1B49D|nr:response regulator transcription factor [Sedimenticola hydrogenitrophicus]